MKKVAIVSLLLTVVLLASVASSEAGTRGWRHYHHGPRVFIGVGPGWWGPYPYWYYPPPYYSYPYYSYPYYPPAVVVQQPPVYVEQEPAPAAPAPAAQGYWHYCASTTAYYPTVQTCAEPWIKVPPRSE